MKHVALITTAALTASLPLVSAQAVAGEKRTHPTRRPNLLFIITDQQRFDAMGIAGAYPYLRTPNLDRLAREGAYFTHAYSPCAVSVASRCSILTGLLVDHHRV